MRIIFDEYTTFIFLIFQKKIFLFFFRKSS